MKSQRAFSERSGASERGLCTGTEAQSADEDLYP